MNFPTPAVTTTLADIGAWASPIFDDFFPWAKLAIGVIIGFGVIAWIVRMFTNALHRGQ